MLSTAATPFYISASIAMNIHLGCPSFLSKMFCSFQSTILALLLNSLLCILFFVVVVVVVVVFFWRGVHPRHTEVPRLGVESEL